jgi:hypothetical protein
MSRAARGQGVTGNAAAFDDPTFPVVRDVSR